MDISSVKALDHRGGAGAGFDGLKDAEGNERTAIFIVQAVDVDDEADVGEGLGELEGVHTDLPDVVPTADVEGGGGRLPRDTGVDVRELEGDVADAGAPVCDAQLTRAGGDVLAILTAHVRDAHADARLASLAASLPHRRRHSLACTLLSRHYHVHVLAFSFIQFWVAEQLAAKIAGSARSSSVS